MSQGFDGLFEAYLADLQQRRRASSTREHARQVLPRFFEHLREHGVRDLLRVNEGHIVGFARSLSSLIDLSESNRHLWLVRIDLCHATAWHTGGTGGAAAASDCGAGQRPDGHPGGRTDRLLTQCRDRLAGRRAQEGREGAGGEASARPPAEADGTATGEAAEAVAQRCRGVGIPDCAMDDQACGVGD
jgi:hypothetical protein